MCTEIREKAPEMERDIQMDRFVGIPTSGLWKIGFGNLGLLTKGVD